MVVLTSPVVVLRYATVRGARILSLGNDILSLALEIISIDSDARAVI